MSRQIWKSSGVHILNPEEAMETEATLSIQTNGDFLLEVGATEITFPKAIALEMAGAMVKDNG
jgi:hypothetical protein